MPRVVVLFMFAAGLLLNACDEDVPQPALADLAAKPTWGASVPQIEAGPLFGTLAPTPVPFHGTLICRIRASEQRQWDPALVPQQERHIPPELIVAAELPGGLNVSVSGPPNRHVMFYSVPNLRLDAGQEIRLAVNDEDIAVNDHVGSLEMTARQFPMRGEDGELSAECRGVPAADAQTRASAFLAAADRALDALEGLDALQSVAPGTAASPLQPLDLESVQRALSGAAAWVGWSHSEIVARQLRLATAATARETRAQQRWVETLGALPGNEPAALNPWTRVQLIDVQCARQCVVHVRVEYQAGSTGKPIELEALGSNRQVIAATEYAGTNEDGTTFPAGSWHMPPKTVVHEFSILEVTQTPVAWRVRDPDSGSSVVLRPTP
ncbi:MAG: hypothetical protein AB8H86_13730 [Polyangiales bacterium]